MYKQLQISTLLLSLGLAGCTGVGLESRSDRAAALAQKAQLSKHKISAAPFVLTSYQRISAASEPVRVYIEGDGLAWTGRSTPSLDPTPTNPVGLELASMDDAANVVYLARPCQYTKMTLAEPCPSKYWTNDRFAPEIVGSMNAALDQIKDRYPIQQFELVGFSGGGAVAALVSAKRSDVVSLRTVAGNLNHGLVMRTHGVSALTGSLDAIDIAPQISNIPQHHFIGAEDTVITPEIAESFKRASGISSCIRTTIVPEATHEKGWSQWPALLKFSLDCSN